MNDAWVFGYGSLIWRPSFPFVERRRASIVGFARRLWQGSDDHRGVPGALGRVVTLVPMPGARCVGVAFRIAAPEVESVLAHLDHREKNGYERHHVDLHGDDQAVFGALCHQLAQVPFGGVADRLQHHQDVFSAGARDALIFVAGEHEPSRHDAQGFGAKAQILEVVFVRGGLRRGNLSLPLFYLPFDLAAAAVGER